MEKLESFVQFLCFLPELWSINCPKKCIFYNFVVTSARNLGLLKQFTYMRLKVLTTLFQKMVWFILVILVIKKYQHIKKDADSAEIQQYSSI